VLELRLQLAVDGLDAGPETIRWHLQQEQLRVLSTSTIRRILHDGGLIVAEPEDLLAQPKQQARPLATLPKLRPMSRLRRDLCPDS